MDSESMSAVMKPVVYARVRLRAFSRAAVASAARAVARGARVERMDLDLAGPNRDCPFAPDDDPAPLVCFWKTYPSRTLPPPCRCPRRPLARRQRSSFVSEKKCAVNFSRSLRPAQHLVRRGSMDPRYAQLRRS